MEYQIEFSHSPHFISKTAKTFWLKDYGMTYVYYAGIPLLTFALGLTSSELTSSKAGNMLLGVLLGIGATLALQFLYQFLSFDKAAATAAQPWKDVKVIQRFDEKGIVTESELASGNYTWSMVKELRQTPKAWMLIFSGQDYIALPTELLSEELKQFIARKVAEAERKAA